MYSQARQKEKDRLHLYKTSRKALHHCYLNKNATLPGNDAKFLKTLCHACIRPFTCDLKYIKKNLILQPFMAKNPSLLPDIGDPDHHCRACDQMCDSQEDYFDHLVTIHKDQFEGMCHLDTDEDKAEYYCNRCTNEYRQHLEKLYKVYSKKACVLNQEEAGAFDYLCRLCNISFSIRKAFIDHLCQEHSSNVQQDTKKPDPMNPQNYCCVCDFTYADKERYHTHLLNKHQIKQSMGLEPDPWDPDNHCHSCNFTYKTTKVFRGHLRRIHQIRMPKMRQMNAHVQPNPNDPDFYCKSCNFIYASRDSFVKHLRNMHAISPGSKYHVKDGLYCSICQMTYASQKSYNQHVKHKHKSPKHPHIKPELESPDHFCRSCDIFLRNKREYETHLRKVHQIRVKNMVGLTPDIHDPHHYCLPCNYRFKNKKSFHGHLREIHDLYSQGPRSKQTSYSPNHCHRCNMTYASNERYQHHLEVKHPI